MVLNYLAMLQVLLEVNVQHVKQVVNNVQALFLALNATLLNFTLILQLKHVNNA